MTTLTSRLPTWRSTPEEGFRVLSLETRHLPALATLPFHHRDPFDRLIICQAMAENMPVCTGDSHFADYGIKQVW